MLSKYNIIFLPFSPADGDPNENVGILGATGGFSEVVVVDAGVPNENAGLVVVEEVEDAGLSVVVVVAPNLNGDAAADDVVVAVVIAGVAVVVVVVLAKGEEPCLGDVDPNENVGLSAVVVVAAAGFSVVDFSVVAGFSVEAAAGVVVLPKLKDGVLTVALGDAVVVLPIENGWDKVVSVAIVLSPVAVMDVAAPLPPNVNPPAILGDAGVCCCAVEPNVNILAVGDVVVLLVLDKVDPNAVNEGGVDGVVVVVVAGTAVPVVAGVKEGEPKGDVVAVVLEAVAPAPKGDVVGEPNLNGCCACDEGAAVVVGDPKLGAEVVVVGAVAPKVGAAAGALVPKVKEEGDEGCDPPLPN